MWTRPGPATTFPTFFPAYCNPQNKAKPQSFLKSGGAGGACTQPFAEYSSTILRVLSVLRTEGSIVTQARIVIAASQGRPMAAYIFAISTKTHSPTARGSFCNSIVLL